MRRLLFHWLVGLAALIAIVGFSYFPLSLPLKAADIEAIQARGHLLIAVKDNLRPLGFRDATGQLQGFEIDIARQLAVELFGSAEAVVLQPVANQERLTVVVGEQVDGAIAHLTATSTRSRVVTFSLPYYFDGTALVTTNAAIRSLGDLGTETIAALDGSSAVEALRYRWPNARLVEVRSYYQAQTLLETGQVAAFAGDASVLSGWVQEFPQYRLVLPVLTVEPLCIGLPKGIQHDSLRQRINQILEQWYKTGWLKERASYWGLPWDTGVEQRRDRP